jgi:hypothetical protein
MRRLLIVLATLVACSAPTWADSIELDVNAWATFTATQPCSSNCTETIGVNFLYRPPSDFPDTPKYELQQDLVGQIVAGSMDVTASGFMGAFNGNGTFMSTQGYIPFYDSMRDEIDLNVPVGTGGIQTGMNTLSFTLFTCQTAACLNAMGPDASHFQFYTNTESSVVTRVGVPDGDSSPLLMLVALVPIGVAYRWRGQGRACPLV